MTNIVADQDINRKTLRLFLNATIFLSVFIFYAALLPFNLSSTPAEASLGGFIDTLLYSSTSTAQGQWIGHVIFNLLLTFFASLYCQLSPRRNIWPIVYGLIVLFGLLIEYSQMFIGSRGTSMVDVYANLAGMGFGFMTWKVFGEFTLKAVHYIYKHMTLPVDFVKKIYLAFVIVVILFPFDFYLNWLQVEVAFATKGIPLFENEIGFGFGMISLIAAMLLLFPLGVIYQMSLPPGSSIDKRLILKFAGLLLALEILQFFEVSGQSSLPSYFFKLLGFCIGLIFGRFLSLTILLEMTLRLRLFFTIVFPLFLYVALKVKGADFSFASSLSSISTVLEETSFLPFRYYVVVGSGEALLSFLLNFVIFVPIGCLIAIHQISEGRQYKQTFSGLVWIGFFSAIILEGIVLIWGLKRPDVTNIMLGACALPVGYYLLVMVSNAVFQNKND